MSLNHPSLFFIPTKADLNPMFLQKGFGFPSFKLAVPSNGHKPLPKGAIFASSAAATVQQRTTFLPAVNVSTLVLSFTFLSICISVSFAILRCTQSYFNGAIDNFTFYSMPLFFQTENSFVRNIQCLARISAALLCPIIVTAFFSIKKEQLNFCGSQRKKCEIRSWLPLC